MSQWVKWCFSVTAFLILGSFIQQLLPDQADRKYIRFFWGILFLLVAVQPVTELLNLDGLFEQYVETFSSAWNGSANHVFDQEEVEAQIDEAMLSAYQEGIAWQVNELVKDQGYQVQGIQVTWKEEGGSGQWEDILEITGELIPVTPKEDGAVEVVNVQQIRLGGMDSRLVREDALSETVADYFQIEGNRVQLCVEVQDEGEVESSSAG